MTDAWGRLMSADEFLKRHDYAGAIREAQVALELASKVLLDRLSIEYFIEEGGKRKFKHDVSEKIPEAFERLKPYLKESEIPLARVDLARISTLVKLLTSIKDYVVFGINVGGRKVGATEIFGPNFDDAAKALVGLTRLGLRTIQDWMWELEKQE